MLHDHYLPLVYRLVNATTMCEAHLEAGEQYLTDLII
jgi:hypothetical protein